MTTSDKQRIERMCVSLVEGVALPLADVFFKDGNFCHAALCSISDSANEVHVALLGPVLDLKEDVSLGRERGFLNQVSPNTAS